MIIIKKIFKTFLFIATVIVLLPIITFFIDPRHVIDFSDNPVDQKLYADIAFGPIETYFPLFKIGSLTSYDRSYYFYRWSPDGNHFAYIADVPKSEKTKDRQLATIILNPRTLQRKTVLISDYAGRYGWLDNDTIRYFRGAGTGVGVYRDININTKQPLVVGEHKSPDGWHPITLKDMYEMEEKLAKLSN